jgi:hypothetical protein
MQWIYAFIAACFMPMPVLAYIQATNPAPVPFDIYGTLTNLGSAGIVAMVMAWRMRIADEVAAAKVMEDKEEREAARAYLEASEERHRQLARDLGDTLRNSNHLQQLALDELRRRP